MSEQAVRLRHTFFLTDAKDEYIATLDVQRRHGVHWLLALWVHGDHRRKGYATRLMNGALLEFGAHPIYLQVLAYTDQPLSDQELTDWYGRFGFKPTAVPGILFREPPTI